MHLAMGPGVQIETYKSGPKEQHPAPQVSVKPQMPRRKPQEKNVIVTYHTAEV